MNAFTLSLLNVALVSLVSLIGFFTLRIRIETVKSITFLLVSFAVGALFGDVFFHLLPELAEDGFSVQMGVEILLGLLIFFSIEKFIYWRHCHIPTSDEHPHPVAFVNIVGDGLHNFLDGLLIASSFSVNPQLGFATTLAVLLHELPQELGDFGILLHSGLSVGKALFFNFVSALFALFGVVVFFVLGDVFNAEAFLVPLGIGGFLYLAGSDLVPELHKETRAYKSLLQFSAILLGLGVMFSLRFLE